VESALYRVPPTSCGYSETFLQVNLQRISTHSRRPDKQDSVSGNRSDAMSQPDLFHAYGEQYGNIVDLMFCWVYKDGLKTASEISLPSLR
jgi:hypothetical protein